MKPTSAAIAAAMLLAPGAAQSQLVGQDFCWGLKRVVEAAREDGGFLWLERSRAAPPHLGFRHGCRATGDDKRQYWLCNQHLAPEEMSGDALAARVAACHPEAVRGRNGFGEDPKFDLPGARIHISERGGPRAKVGRIVTLTVEAIPAR
jgi:hypothetical protein